MSFRSDPAGSAQAGDPLLQRPVLGAGNRTDARAGTERSAVKLSTGASGARSGFSPDAVGHAVGSGSHAACWPSFSPATAPAAPDPARTRGCSHQRTRQEAAGRVRIEQRQNLIIDADDTLWENNIYFERAFDDFCRFPGALLDRARSGARRAGRDRDRQQPEPRLRVAQFHAQPAECYQQAGGARGRDRTICQTVMSFAERSWTCPWKSSRAWRRRWSIWPAPQPDAVHQRRSRGAEAKDGSFGLGGLFRPHGHREREGCAAYAALIHERDSWPRQPG